MIVAEPHPREADRLAALHELAILDTAEEAAYDELAGLAARLLDTPVALVSLVDEARQWFKARHGLDTVQTPRDAAFCAHAILAPGAPLVVEDASADPRFANNPLVTGAPHVRAHAGMALSAPGSGLPLGTLCVLGDTPRCFTPAQLQDLQLLARQVERLLQLRYDNLEIQRMVLALAHASDAKSRFLAAMSHDIRTPMNGILGAAELMQHEPLPDRARELLGTLQACGRSLLSLVDNVLDLARIEAGGVVLEDESISLETMLADVLAAVRQVASDKGLELEITSKALPRVVRGDARRLRQVLLNLVGNAVKFTEHGRVALHAQPTDDGLVRFEISDTGAGIDAQDIRRLGQPFVQVGKPVAAHASGSGLGLSIVNSLLDAMGGRLSVTSSPGQGSRFIVELPLQLGESGRDRGADVARATEATPASLAMRVLVVDDDAVNRRVIEAMLQRLGVDVVLADSGEAALTHDWYAFDLVLMDCHMPGIDGLETTRRWRARETGAAVPVFALTADALLENRTACFDAGMDDFLTKPITLEELRRALHKVAPPPEVQLASN